MRPMCPPQTAYKNNAVGAYLHVQKEQGHLAPVFVISMLVYYITTV